MEKFLIALTLGAIVGAIDIIPMVRKKVYKYSIIAVFAQWMLLGLLIPFVSWGIQPWLKGMIIGLLGMVPTMVVAYDRNRSAVIPTGIFGAVFGSLLGIAGYYFVQ